MTHFTCIWVYAVNVLQLPPQILGTFMHVQVKKTKKPPQKMVKDTDQHNVDKSLILLIDNWQFGHLGATQQLKLQHWPLLGYSEPHCMQQIYVGFFVHNITNLHHSVIF